jgi:hypothetical protein
MTKQKCEYGCDNTASYYFKSSKKWCCSKATSTCPGMKIKNSEKVKEYVSSFDNPNDRWKNGHPKGATGGVGLKGKTFEEIYGDRSEEMKQRRRDSFTIPLWDRMTADQQELHRKNSRELIVNRYASGWMPKAGRCKKITYFSPIAGFVKLDGSWELIAAKYFDRVGYTWIRNTTRFKYLDGDKERFYTPDFWIEELDSYIEIKGYETELDRKKWAQFPEPIQVWKKDKITQISKI